MQRRGKKSCDSLNWVNSRPAVLPQPDAARSLPKVQNQLLGARRLGFASLISIAVIANLPAAALIMWLANYIYGPSLFLGSIRSAALAGPLYHGKQKPDATVPVLSFA